MQVLEPIYRTYPYLAAQNLAATPNPTSAAQSEKPDASHKMGPVTAVHLHWAQKQALNAWPKELTDKDCGASPAATCFPAMTDIMAEIGFAGRQADLDYPDLWQLTARALERKNLSKSRTKASDTYFRKNSAANLTFTPAAIGRLRDFQDAARKQSVACYIATITWTSESAMKGPDDVEWKKRGPHVELGGFGCSQVPPDTIQKIGGLPVVILNDKPGRFDGKMIDFVEGKLVIKDH